MTNSIKQIKDWFDSPAPKVKYSKKDLETLKQSNREALDSLKAVWGSPEEKEEVRQKFLKDSQTLKDKNWYNHDHDPEKCNCGFGDMFSPPKGMEE